MPIDRWKRRATVVAEATTDRIDLGSIQNGYRLVSPGVEVKVEYSHGEHEAALHTLDAMVAEVKAQINDAAGGSGG